MDALWHVAVAGRRRVAVGDTDAPRALTTVVEGWDELVRGGPATLRRALAEDDAREPLPDDVTVLPPVAGQEVWASGVTYRRSRDARMEESDTPDHYDRVYDADRPELFPKAAGWRVRGDGEPIGVRADSTWDVPEAELALVVAPDGALLGCTIGDDVSSRDIEGANPLYLPQAKSYTGSCALGPCLVPLDWDALTALTIGLTIRRDGAVAHADEVGTDQLHRDPRDLVGWLLRALEFPDGVVLLTGTGMVPPSDFTLAAGDEVTITITGLGTLTNTVEVVGDR